MRVNAQINEPNVDFDLNMMARSDKGSKSAPSAPPTSTAPTRPTSTMSWRAAGEENILVKKLSVASYMAWLAPAPSYQ
jgi:hypothetical protein